ncbi:CBS domain-containing protein [Methanocella arvoryzae]|uniref:Conserved hypothetical CBS domain protein n=1 Tax=Methanocella arvoryzae (strain DSM 22066 / NBRC 105507 / MRE50) TaxID=351160 RepID=Q0W3J7_METAR|nr:CBS domain-containing protein [Methanocella arvoryzae]CAJ37046.1 conserved hypothetical CBS domain protein [Methanocella arvoryzae MRE50]
MTQLTLMKLKDVMSKPLIIDKSDRITEALDMMDKHHVRRLIVRHSGQVMGIISIRSICESLGSRRKYNHPPSLFHAADALSNSFALLSPDDELEKAIQALKEVDAVVVADTSIRGSISTSDILRHVAPSGPVASLMKTPITAPPDARVSHIRRLMMEQGVSRVPIMDGATLVGMVSETDVAAAFRGVKRRSAQNHEDNNVERMIAMDILRVNVITVSPETDIREAARIMLENDIGALPVLDDRRRLVGIITRRDIVRAI